MSIFFVNAYFQTDDWLGSGTADNGKQPSRIILFDVGVPSICRLLTLSFINPH